MGIQVDLSQVVGRDELIARVWKLLRKSPGEGSLRFTAERRVGKTTVMSKMAAEPPEDFDVIFLEVEGVDSCERLVELILTRIKPLFSPTTRTLDGFRSLLNALGGTEVAGIVKLPEAHRMEWYTAIERAIEQLCHSRPDRLVLFMFDELPYMLQKIGQTSAHRNTPHEALTLLDTLRALRQRHANLRMIFAGSVGLHHVLRELKHTKLASEPVNNMPLVEIGPLDIDSAAILAERLLAAERVTFTSNGKGLAIERLIAVTNQVPFYMERIASQLGLLAHPISASDVEDTFQEQLSTANDPWEMEHFRERLETYYQDSIHNTQGQPLKRSAVARSVLDQLSTLDQPASIDEVLTYLKSQFAIGDRQDVIQTLRWLELDHYLKSDRSKRFEFRFGLLKRWWKLNQGLDE